MTPQEFVDKWKAVDQTERATAQSHFNDLCDLLGEPKPHDADPKGEWYAFEKGAAKAGGGDGWADVWKRKCFGWEYKGKHKDLDRAYTQLQQYAVALENPPLLIVSDIERIRIITNWTNNVSVRYDITLEDLLKPAKRQLLKDAFNGSEVLRTGESRTALTQKVAKEFATLAQELEAAGNDPLAAAHFVNRLVFCMFAEDAGILPDHIFSEMLDSALAKPEEFVEMSSGLFAAMSLGGRVGFKKVEWFNGGLFDDNSVIPLTRRQIQRVRDTTKLDWSAIDPSIFGTLFERGLDPSKRGQLGAHYTDSESIMRIVEPVVLRPLRQEWEIVKSKIEKTKKSAAKSRLLAQFRERLSQVRILDPACGSGNFLYLALRGLKDFEHLMLFEAETLGLGRAYPEIGIECVKGIEISPYAAELARVTVWIGELQWQMEHGFNVDRNPVLKPLETIENRDALLNADGTEAEWPAAEFIIGNPPFIGDKKMRASLGDDYVDRVRKGFEGNVPGSADFVCYWFYLAGRQLAGGMAKYVGLVATNKIRKGKNNDVLREAIRCNSLFDAWSDFPWHDEVGAAVRVSIVCFGRTDAVKDLGRHLNGQSVAEILPDLTPRNEEMQVDVGLAKPLAANRGKSFNGICLAGEFDVNDASARVWLTEPNAAGFPNSDVLRPLYNGRDVTQRWAGRWLIDFGVDMSEQQAAQYAAPFNWVEEYVKPDRIQNNRPARAKYWWRAGEARPGMRTAIADMSRILVTPETAKHRFFVWLPSENAPDHMLVVIATDNDYFHGILSSRVHVNWMLATGNRLGVGNDPRYNSSRTFLTFPFPEPTDAIRNEIAEAARDLNELRENWLNPPEWTKEETLVFPATVGGPWRRWIPNADALPPASIADAHYVRRVAHPAMVKTVAKRTLTNLYNERPAWLRHAHDRLDTAAAAAYGFPFDISDADLLAALLKLNLELAT